MTRPDPGQLDFAPGIVAGFDAGGRFHVDTGFAEGGQFAKPGWSGAKALAVNAVRGLLAQEAARDRPDGVVLTLNEHAPPRVRRWFEREQGHVRAVWHDDEHAKVDIDGRRVLVPWDAFEDPPPPPPMPVAAEMQPGPAAKVDITDHGPNGWAGHVIRGRIRDDQPPVIGWRAITNTLEVTDLVTVKGGKTGWMSRGVAGAQDYGVPSTHFAGSPDGIFGRNAIVSFGGDYHGLRYGTAVAADLRGLSFATVEKANPDGTIPVGKLLAGIAITEPIPLDRIVAVRELTPAAVEKLEALDAPKTWAGNEAAVDEYHRQIAEIVNAPGGSIEHTGPDAVAEWLDRVRPEPTTVRKGNYEYLVAPDGTSTLEGKPTYGKGAEGIRRLAHEQVSPQANDLIEKPEKKSLADRLVDGDPDGVASDLAALYSVDLGNGIRTEADVIYFPARNEWRALGQFVDGNRDDKWVGEFDRLIAIDDEDGAVVVSHETLSLDEGTVDSLGRLRGRYQGKGYGTRFVKATEDAYVDAGFDRIETHASSTAESQYDNGAYVWARQGFGWDLSSAMNRKLFLRSARPVAQDLANVPYQQPPSVDDETAALVRLRAHAASLRLTDLIDRVDTGLYDIRPDDITPGDIAALGAKEGWPVGMLSMSPYANRSVKPTVDDTVTIDFMYSKPIQRRPAARADDQPAALDVLFEDPIVNAIIDRFAQDNQPVYLVGGALRSALMGEVPNDIDLTTPALPEQSTEMLADVGTVFPLGEKFGTVVVNRGGVDYEVTTHRTETYNPETRAPEVGYTTDLTEDLARRDFTVNAMAVGTDRRLIDPFGGRQDLDAKIIRAVGDPIDRFTEDPLRIVRAVRFAATLGFDIDPATKAAAATVVDRLSIISRERFNAEMAKVLKSERPGALADAVRLAAEIGAEQAMFGPLAGAALRVDLDDVRPHMHSDATVAEHRFAVLVDDAHQHDGVDPRSLVESMKRGRSEMAELDTVIRAADEMRSNLDSLVPRRIVRRLNDRQLDLLRSIQPEMWTEDPPTAGGKAYGQRAALRDRLPINGNDLMELGLKGRGVGEALDAVTDAFLANGGRLTADEAYDIAERPAPQTNDLIVPSGETLGGYTTPGVVRWAEKLAAQQSHLDFDVIDAWKENPTPRNAERLWDVVVGQTASRRWIEETLTSDAPAPDAVETLRQAHLATVAEMGEEPHSFRRYSNTSDPFDANETGLGISPDPVHRRPTRVTSWMRTDGPYEINDDDFVARDEEYGRNLHNRAFTADQVLANIGDMQDWGEYLIAEDPAVVERLMAGNFPIVEGPYATLRTMEPQTTASRPISDLDDFEIADIFTHDLGAFFSTADVVDEAEDDQVAVVAVNLWDSEDDSDAMGSGWFSFANDGEDMVATFGMIEIQRGWRGEGIGTRFLSAVEAALAAHGVSRIEGRPTSDSEGMNGAYAWARTGFEWANDDDPHAIGKRMLAIDPDNEIGKALTLGAHGPTPGDVALDPVGKRVLLGQDGARTEWHGVKRLVPAPQTNDMVASRPGMVQQHPQHEQVMRELEKLDDDTLRFVRDNTDEPTLAGRAATVYAMRHPASQTNDLAEKPLDYDIVDQGMSPLPYFRSGSVHRLAATNDTVEHPERTFKYRSIDSVRDQEYWASHVTVGVGRNGRRLKEPKRLPNPSAPQAGTAAFVDYHLIPGGLTTFRETHADGTFTDTHPPDRVYIDYATVADGHRGQGLASKLIDNLAARYPDARLDFGTVMAPEMWRVLERLRHEGRDVTGKADYGPPLAPRYETLERLEGMLPDAPEAPETVAELLGSNYTLDDVRALLRRGGLTREQRDALTTIRDGITSPATAGR